MGMEEGRPRAVIKPCGSYCVPLCVRLRVGYSSPESRVLPPWPPDTRGGSGKKSPLKSTMPGFISVTSALREDFLIVFCLTFFTCQLKINMFIL